MTLAMNKFDAGRTAFEAGQFEEALIAFQASNNLNPSPNSKLYIARCYRALRKVASAYTTYRMAAREAQDRLTASGEKRYAATRDSANSEGRSSSRGSRGSPSPSRRGCQTASS
jgi:tetratricopeptide (TPR) repeat protein